jgi:hypothetical protein
MGKILGLSLWAVVNGDGAIEAILPLGVRVMCKWGVV